MTNQHRCMALNRDMTDRCPRKATKMLATLPWHDEGPSITTVRLCGICTRSLHSGSRSLCLQLDDGTRHTCWVGHGIGETYVKQDRGEV